MHNKTLNLVYQNNSDISYKIFQFPDGQQQVTIIGYKTTTSEGWGKDFKDFPVTIKSRLNNFKDLELIACSVASLKELGVKKIHLYVPYILGSRSDRKFEDGGNNYLKDVICPIINSLNFESVSCIDPHSDVLEACINNFRKEDNYQLMRFALVPPIYEPNTEDNFVLISPDAGANKKIYKLAEQIGYIGDIITCTKDRDKDGKLTRTTVPTYQQHNNKDCIIIDDICDGGATFINIAKEVKKGAYKGKLYLIITHGIFSKGYSELLKYFDGIYCTNSYSDFRAFEDSDIQYKNKIKHLNIF